jgi:hypothetical protein
MADNSSNNNSGTNINMDGIIYLLRRETVPVPEREEEIVAGGLVQHLEVVEGRMRLLK